MNDIYIVLYRHKNLTTNPWRASTNGIFTEEKLAKNFVECSTVSEPDYDFVIVSGPITNPQQIQLPDDPRKNFRVTIIPHTIDAVKALPHPECVREIVAAALESQSLELQEEIDFTLEVVRSQ